MDDTPHTAIAGTENTTPSTSSQNSNSNSNTAVTLPDGEIASAGVAASSGSSSEQQRQPPKKIDTEILDHILGKSDAQRMIEAVRDLKSEGVYTAEQKQYIWDDLELVSLRRVAVRICVY